MTYEFPISDEAKTFIESAKILAEPWRERVAALEADRDSWRRVAERLESGIQAVRELHRKITTTDDFGFCTGCEFSWPCPTATLVAGVPVDSTEEKRPLKCIGNDPTCPCQDGDVCHYVDDPLSETLAWPVPVDSKAKETPK